MTIKELASFTARTERTIRRWINKAELTSDTLSAKMSDAMKTNIAGDYTLDETEQILRCSSLPKIVVDDLINNARQPKEISVIDNNENMLMTFMLKMQEQQQQFMSAVLSELKSNKPNEPKLLSLPVAPDIEPRAYLNQLVREYSSLKEVDFRTAWNVLYTEILYRCKTNIKVKAKNDGIKPIDYLEQANLLLTACSIMKSIIG